MARAYYVSVGQNQSSNRWWVPITAAVAAAGVAAVLAAGLNPFGEFMVKRMEEDKTRRTPPDAEDCAKKVSGICSE